MDSPRTVDPSPDPTPRHLAATPPLPLWAQALGVVACLAVALGIIAGSALAYARDDGGCQAGRGSSLDSGTCVETGRP